jgi:toxin ParE1/3/4
MARFVRVYGLKQWGERQADNYHAALTRGFELLRDNPQIGVAKDDLSRGLRAFPVEHHVLYYRIKGEEIEISRVLHERADAARHFS